MALGLQDHDMKKPIILLAIFLVSLHYIYSAVVKFSLTQHNTCLALVLFIIAWTLIFGIAIKEEK